MYSYIENNGYTNLEDRIYSLDEITEYVLRDMEILGKNVRVIESPQDAQVNEYVVAMKTSTQSLPVSYTMNADYHFAVLLNDGTWADKPGQTPSRWNEIDGTASSWDLATPQDYYYIEGYYNTESVYFAVEECIE